MGATVGSFACSSWMARTDRQNSRRHSEACIVDNMDSVVETSPETPSKIIYPEDDLLAPTEATDKLEEPTTPGTVAFPVNEAEECAVETKETQDDAGAVIVEADTSATEPLSLEANEEPAIEAITEDIPEVAAPNNDNSDIENTATQQESDSADVPPPPPSESVDTAPVDTNPFEEHIERAIKAKQEATEAYKKSDLMTARLNYLIALEALQQVQGDLSNKTKATLFEHTVTNNNNVALCSLGLEEYGQAVAFATNVVVLISSLERNMPDGQVWKNLSENGITEDQLRKVWKKKAHYYLGKAHLKRGNHEEAIEAFEAALALIADDAALVVNANELRTLIADAKAKLAKQKQKQKKTWSKAFEKRKLEPDAPEDSNSSPAPSAPTTPLGKASSAGAPFDPNNMNFDLGLKKDGKAKTSGSSNSNGGKPTSTAVSTWTWSSDMLLWGVLGTVSALALAFWQPWRHYRNRF